MPPTHGIAPRALPTLPPHTFRGAGEPWLSPTADPRRALPPTRSLSCSPVCPPHLGGGSRSPHAQARVPSLCRGSGICCTTGVGASPAPANLGVGDGCAGPGTPPRHPFLFCLKRF